MNVTAEIVKVVLVLVATFAAVGGAMTLLVLGLAALEPARVRADGRR